MGNDTLSQPSKEQIEASCTQKTHYKKFVVLCCEPVNLRALELF